MLPLSLVEEAMLVLLLADNFCVAAVVTTGKILDVDDALK
jgi:hypothetical protein